MFGRRERIGPPEQIHIADAVHLAGGLSPDAQTEDVQVFRYLPDGKFKIFSVNLNSALSPAIQRKTFSCSRETAC